MFRGCRAPKYLTEGVPSNIWGVYSPQIFDGWGSVKFLGGLQPPKYLTDGVPSNIWGLHPQNVSRKGFRQIYGGCRAPKYLTEGVPSNIWGVYTPKIFDRRGSVKYFGGVEPPNI